MIRYPINAFIISINNLHPIIMVIVFIVYNIGLTFLLYHLMRDLKKKLSLYFLWTIALVIIERCITPLFVYFDGPMSGDNPNFIAWLNKGREFKIAARRANQEAHRFERMSRQFDILAPIMDKQGKGALHDIFLEQSKSCKKQVPLHLN